MSITSILAQSITDVSNNWWDTTFGKTIRGFLVFGGIILTMRGVAAFVKESSNGRVGKAFSAAVGSFILAMFMFRPQMATALIDLMSGLLDTLISDADNLNDQGKLEVVD